MQAFRENAVAGGEMSVRDARRTALCSCFLAFALLSDDAVEDASLVCILPRDHSAKRKYIIRKLLHLNDQSVATSIRSNRVVAVTAALGTTKGSTQLYCMGALQLQLQLV